MRQSRAHALVAMGATASNEHEFVNPDLGCPIAAQLTANHDLESGSERVTIGQFLS